MPENEDTAKSAPDEVKNNIRQAIEQGLENVNFDQLAVFRWTTREGRRGGPINFRFDGVSDNHGRRFSLEVGGKIYDFRWAVQTDKRHRILLCLQIWENGEKLKGGNHVIATPASGVDGPQIDYDPDEHLRKPHGSQVLQQFARTWYEEDESLGKGSVLKPGIKRDEFPPGPQQIKDFWPTYDDGQWTCAPPPPRCPENESDDEWSRRWGAFVLTVAIWRFTLYLHNGGDPEAKEARRDIGWPAPQEYRPARPVNLSPSQVNARLMSGEKGEKLYFPWHVIEAACASLNSGKHLILTGPPGCGKSKLAIALAKMAEKNPLTVTASPAWTTGELIGRYMPSRGEAQMGDGLVFEPGFFLQALENDSWLIIDEINRSDIDMCFGELFSVLAGDMVTLPFRQRAEEEQEIEEGQDGQMPHVRIIPEQKGEETEAGKADYAVPDSFRLIGTMNDADRSHLSQLSFALQRRFNTIRVESPGCDTIKKIADETRNKVKKDLQLCEGTGLPTGKNGYCFKTTTRYWAGMERAKEVLAQLFWLRGGNLVTEKVVGVASVVDILNYVGEALRPSGTIEICVGDDYKNGRKPATEFVHSQLALALVLCVYPQLQSLTGDPEKLKDILKIIFRPFRGCDMCRIQKKGDEDTEGFERVTERSISDFLWAELESTFGQSKGLITELRKELVDNGLLAGGSGG